MNACQGQPLPLPLLRKPNFLLEIDLEGQQTVPLQQVTITTQSYLFSWLSSNICTFF